MQLCTPVLYNDTYMKKHFFYFAIFALIMLSACSEQKKEKALTAHEKFISELTAQDTLDILNLSNACMDTLKLGNVDAAIKMLYVIRNDSLIRVPDYKEKELRQKFKLFPVLDYKLEYYAFIDQANNDVKYQIEFFKHNSPDDKTPNTIGFMMNPVKVDGKWFLTLKEPNEKVMNN